MWYRKKDPDVTKKPVTTTSTTKSTSQNSSNTTSSQNRNTSDVEQKMIRLFGDRVLRLMGLDNTDATNITMEQIAELRRSVPRHELESFVNEVNREFPSLGVVLPSQDQVERDEERCTRSWTVEIKMRTRKLGGGSQGDTQEYGYGRWALFIVGFTTITRLLPQFILLKNIFIPIIACYP